MVNTEIRLIIFFAAKDGEALYSQQKQDWELNVAQIMNSLLPNSDWNWTFLWGPTRPFNTPNRCPSYYRGLECKSRKSRNTWRNRQIWPWSTEWSRAKANRVLPRERTGHSKHPLPTTQEKTLHMDITRWSTPKSDWFAAKDGEALYSQQKQDRELTVA